MISELDELQNRYDDLLLTENKSDADWSEIFAIERQIRDHIFGHPRREDFTDEEWNAFYPEWAAALEAYDAQERS